MTGRGLRKPKRIGFLASVMILAVFPALAPGGTVTGKVDFRGRPIKPEAVVYIEKADKEFPPPEKPAEVDQVNMKFVPHVTPVVVGTTVKFLNSDPVLHNVFTPSKAGDKFNLGTWPAGESKTYIFKKPGEVALLCNVHPEMEAFVVILQNPYFSTTARDGSFSIAGVPAGTYTLKVWHEKRKPATQSVTVPESGSVEANLSLR